ncbi:uroporphyrinogen-III synthase [Shewanella waksmanii]|uniref:uroporphyrinogen-III synthase n=1 Tax=Shewanella waksmanii TaxID=213783 RepID=UPI0004902B5E|nr:uroporphyrinogen-III synthase [Shewanella waksmanii]
MTVLLTRPQGRNQSMVEALTSKGVPHFTTPLLAVEPYLDSAKALSAFKQAELIIFISTNAVTYAAQLCEDFPQARYFAVGGATYDALAALGIEAEQAPSDNQQTEGLLTLPALQRLTDSKICIVRGVGGRETLAEQLSARGAQLSYWQVYQRQCPKLDGAKLVKDWQHHQVDTIVVTSGEILANLINLVPKEQFAWLQACHIIVPSIRVYQQAQAAGFSQVTNAKAANKDAVLGALGL